MTRLASLSFVLALALPAVALAQTPPTTPTTTDAGTTPGGDDTAAGTPTGNTGATTTTGTSTTTTTSNAPPPSTTSSSVAPMHPVTNEPGPSGSQPEAHWAPYEHAPRDDNRPNHLVYIEITGGGHWLDMYAVSHSSNFLPPMTVHTSDTGIDVGVAAGIRPVAFFGVGARATLGFFPTYNFGIAAAEIELRIPTKVVEPFLRVGLGYAWIGGANYGDPAMSSTTIYGFAGTSSLGLDIFLSESFSIGAAFDVDVLNLSRQKPTTGAATMIGSFDLSQDGNAVGLHIGGHVAIALHFL